MVEDVKYQFPLAAYLCDSCELSDETDTKVMEAITKVSESKKGANRKQHKLDLSKKSIIVMSSILSTSMALNGSS